MKLKNKMANFKLAYPIIKDNEGGYANVEGDGGGETYAGVSRVYFPNWKGWAIVDAHKPLKDNERIDSPDLEYLLEVFYETEFWNKMRGSDIAKQSVASYLYDFYVNARGNAIKCVQRVIGSRVDGGVGKMTIEAINSYTGDLLDDLHAERLKYYMRIGDGKNAKFLNGWLDRAERLYKALK